ncbi:MAG: hypothetical protein KC731_12595 [Myxococcales bacterium]|nr:hypothetical protein [Myxococcales bacterium]
MPSFCLECRNLLAEEALCDLCHGEVVRLHDEPGRAALEAEAWIQRSEKRLRGWLVNLCIAVFGVGGLVALCAVTILSVKRDWGIFPFEIILGTVVWMLGWILIALIPNRFPEIVVERRGRGVAPRALPSGEERLEGTVRCEGDEAAWALELRASGETTFHHARSEGFAIETSGGRVVDVPAGRLRVFLPEAMPSEASEPLAETVAEARVTKATGLSASEVARLFPHDAAWAWRLRDGERVRARATLVDELAVDASYRNQAVARRHATGIVWLEPAS